MNTFDGTRLTRRELNDYATTCMLHPDEIALAIHVLDENNENVAYFGINGCFLYSEHDVDEKTFQ